MDRIVFISGSISITSLPQLAIQKVNNIIKNNLPVIIGDAAGVDSLVQRYLQENGYRNVIVYYAGNRIRNNIGNWFIKNVSSKNNETGRSLYTLKDIQMANDAKYGLMIWDGKSPGTLNNINQMKSQDKQFFVVVKEIIVDDKHIDLILNKRNVSLQNII